MIFWDDVLENSTGGTADRVAPARYCWVCCGAVQNELVSAETVGDKNDMNTAVGRRHPKFCIHHLREKDSPRTRLSVLTCLFRFIRPASQEPLSCQFALVLCCGDLLFLAAGQERFSTRLAWPCARMTRKNREV